MPCAAIHYLGKNPSRPEESHRLQRRIKAAAIFGTDCFPPTPNVGRGQERRNLHPKARDSLLAALRTALNRGDLASGFVQSWSDEFEAVKAKVLKGFGQWLSPNDVGEVVSRFVHERLPEGAREATGPIRDSLSRDAIESSCTAIIEFIESLPRSYEIWFPLPRFEITGDLELTPGISFTRTAARANSLRGLLDSKPLGDTTYLRIRAVGYVTRGLHQSAMSNAVATLKRVLQVGELRYAFAQAPRQDSDYVGMILGTGSQRILAAIVHDTAAGPDIASRINLSADMSRQMSRLVIYDDSMHIGLRSPTIKASAREDGILSHIGVATRLMTETETETSTQSLRSALEWAFDADSDEEPTTGFVKGCIALEAALGEDSDGEQITERLADRCAFLLRKTPIDRHRTRHMIRDVYKLRSQVVHGIKKRFSNADNETAFWGRFHLRVVLDTELQAIEEWWSARGRAAGT